MNNRIVNYSAAQQTALVTQVNRVCPLCVELLYYKKKGRSFKDYELAHIYPLNPDLSPVNKTITPMRSPNNLKH